MKKGRASNFVENVTDMTDVTDHYIINQEVTFPLESAPATIKGKALSSLGQITDASEADIVGGDHAEPTVMRTEIFIDSGQVRKALNEAELALAQSGRYFQRDGRIVEVLQLPSDGSWCIKDLDELGVLHALAGLTQWMRPDNKGSLKYIDPQPLVCKMLSRVGQFEYLQVLSGLAFQPHLRSDATICNIPRYDEKTGLFGVFNADDVIVPEAPTKEDARAALACLEGLIEECALAGR